MKPMLLLLALAGIAAPFRFTPRLISQALSRPAYVAAFLRNGIPRFANLVKYAPPGLDLNGMARFMQQDFRGAFLWDEVARYRDVWKGPLVVKGVMHPQDVEQALRLGVDGLQVSSHGGRQVEALPATIDVLPAVAAAAAGRAAVLFDSGVRSGLDVVRAMALGALRHSKAQVSVAVSGVAGPGGGSRSRPVGTVWMALAGPDGTEAIQKLNRFDRETFKFTTGQQALHLLFRHLMRKAG